MLTVSEVWQCLDALSTPLPAETAPLSAVLGRVLREPVLAPEDQPAFDRSAIDGYVVRLDTPAGATVRLGGVIPVGQLAPEAPCSGTALKLFTGSAVPAGAVGLVMQEDTASAEEGATLLLRVAPSASLIRRRASQARAGLTLLPAGSPLNPGALALLASVGVTHPQVGRRVRVAHLVTGGELVPHDATPAPGQIRDCNSTLLAALLATASAELVAHARAGETYRSASDAFAGLLAAGPDLLLVSGGSSGGEHDHTARLFTAPGFIPAVNQVASRPGKPLLVATRGQQLAFGLPGNPLSHFVCFHLFVAPTLARLAGAEPAPLLRLPLAPGAPLRPNPRETWWPATRTPAGYAPLSWADSSDLTVLARTHALLRVPTSALPETQADGILV
jgi:molybdopterin molybdotransferase